MVFTVNQVAPACIGIGHFTVKAHAGVNRVRFAGRVGGRPLEAGTYRIAARTPSGSVVRRLTLVVVTTAPNVVQLRSLRTANVCAATTALSGPLSVGAAGVAGDVRNPAGDRKAVTSRSGDVPQASGIPVGPPDVHSGVLGSAVEEAGQAIQPLFVALLAASMLLLGMASLPREAVPGPRFHDALVRHRLQLAALGAAALIAVALAFLLT